MASASALWCPVGRVESDLGMPGQRHNGLKVPVLAKLLRILWLRVSRHQKQGAMLTQSFLRETGLF